MGPGDYSRRSKIKEKGAKISDQKNFSRCLLNACKGGHLKIVEYLLAQFANFDTPGCLSVTLEIGNEEIFQKLIDAGANINMVRIYRRNLTNNHY